MTFPRQFRRTLQYTYFLRFSLFVWIFPLVFALLDMRKTYSITRGIFVPERWQGYTCVAFFLVCKGFVALISSRTVVVNGIERFNAAPPRWMTAMLANDAGKCETWPVVLSQVPAMLMFTYLLAVGVAEGVPSGVILQGFGYGIFAAILFCYGINAWYYLAYECPAHHTGLTQLALGKNAARTILFPRWAFGLNDVGSPFPPSPGQMKLENLDTWLRGSRLAQISRAGWRWLGRLLPGYSQDGWVYEAQVFSFIATIAFTFLFWVLYPLTAPVPTWWARVSFVALALFLMAIWAVFLSASGGSRSLRLLWKIVLCTLSGIFCAVIPWIYSGLGGERFPTLASVLLLIIVLGWLLSGLAFLFDRYRIPVFTLLLLSIVLPRIAFSRYATGEEHYVSTVALTGGGETTIPTPAQVLEERIAAEPGTPQDQRPFVIVTATGGGLHAGAWMARIMEQVDRSFQAYDQQHGTHEAEAFRGHILLMSTVSGGSAGLSYYLREVDPSAHRDSVNFKRMVVAAQCSSLEAIGWGLVYYDLRKSLVPFLAASSTGVDDLEHPPIGKDRTWALRKGMERNVYDQYCKDRADFDERDEAHDPLGAGDPPATLGQRLWPTDAALRWPQETLSSLHATGGGSGRQIPAFTMNTTSAEAGERVLLANYRIPDYRIGPVEGAPAESFLDLYQSGPRPDLPIPSAAQLSATFPFVSSAARIPLGYGGPNDWDHNKSEHFIDGGYYDNDGTASVLEFLRYALDVPEQSEAGLPVETLCAFASAVSGVQKARDLCDAKRLGDKLDTFRSGEPDCRPVKQKDGSVPQTDCGKIRVILLEIRNSKDSDSPRDPFPRRATAGGLATPEGLLSQLGDPLSGFWQAGHVSVTGRNRNGVDLAIEALKTRLDLHHIIMDDETTAPSRFGIKSADDPLSWSLTPRERRQLRESSDAWNGLGICYVGAVDAFLNFKSAKQANPLPLRCTGSAPQTQDVRDKWLEFIAKHSAWDISQMQPDERMTQTAP